MVTTISSFSSTSFYPPYPSCSSGKIFSTLKEAGRHKLYVEELKSIGFEYSKVKPQKRTAGWGRVKDALMAYKALKGDLEVKRDFIVPR